jgi:hypothetical protein
MEFRVDYRDMDAFAAARRRPSSVTSMQGSARIPARRP